MGTKVDYHTFIKNFDKTLKKYFEQQKKYVCCQRGCADCCKKGDYPLSEKELYFLMEGYSKLSTGTKKIVQANLNCFTKGGQCPFLINNECSVYQYRPIVCRVHGLAYLVENTVILPHCANEGKNFSKEYKNDEVLVEPIKENLEQLYIAEKYNLGETRNIFDWINQQ